MKCVSSTSGGMISFGARLAASATFKALFKEGMDLVEEAAAYLDGPGRDEARGLARPEALAYASESMRLTTRLMQIASWLLLQRAVNEGEMTRTQAVSEKHKVRISMTERAAAAPVYARLPGALTDLSERSIRLQARVAHLDALIHAETGEAPMRPVEAQFDRVRAAFSR